MLKSFIGILYRCYQLALPYGRIKLFTVLSFIFFNGFLQLIGVTSIFPFFALAADPDRIRNSHLGSYFINLLPPLSTNNLLVIAGSFSILMLVVASFGSIASEVIRIRYAYGFCHWLRNELFKSYSSRPYVFFLKRNTTDLYQRLWDIQTFIYSVLLPLGEIITRLVMVILLVGAVFLVQPWVAIGALVVLGGFYLIVFLWLRPRARAIGDGLQHHNAGFAKNSYQFLHGIKTVLVHGKRKYFMQEALIHSLEIGKLQSLIPIYSNGPRYMIEPIAFGGLVSIVIILALRGRPFSDILPNLSVMALAALRLLPTLQLLYGQLVTVATNNYTLKQIEEEIFKIEDESRDFQNNSNELNTISFSKEIRVDKVMFKYSEEVDPILKDFTITISKNESIGITGPSGSGKSTLVDLLLGLHSPSEGQILIDNSVLCSNNIDSWRKMIGYVPQDIYLLDDTVEANIAFGIPLEKVDPDALRNAAQGAQILEFIEKDLPHGFKTLVGERGVRLSGGQRQRIGLARALYHRPQVLILDEATSALDHQTELAVMQTIYELQGKLTIIAVAHRLSTLERADRIIQLG